MPEYITYNPVNGRIVDKFYSVDPSVVEGRENLLEVPRNIFNELTRFHIVDNGVIRLMTQLEKDTLLAEEALALIEAENARILGLDDKIQVGLDGITITKIDTAIDNIGNLNDAKVFLKKLCRYIIKHIA